MLFYYRIWLEDNTEIEATFFANTEGEAFRCVERRYPSWYSVELIHSKRVGRG